MPPTMQPSVHSAHSSVTDPFFFSDTTFLVAAASATRERARRWAWYRCLMEAHFAAEERAVVPFDFLPFAFPLWRNVKAGSSLSGTSSPPCPGPQDTSGGGVVKSSRPSAHAVAGKDLQHCWALYSAHLSSGSLHGSSMPAQLPAASACLSASPSSTHHFSWSLQVVPWKVPLAATQVSAASQLHPEYSSHCQWLQPAASHSSFIGFGQGRSHQPYMTLSASKSSMSLHGVLTLACGSQKVAGPFLQHWLACHFNSRDKAPPHSVWMPSQEPTRLASSMASRSQNMAAISQVSSCHSPARASQEPLE
mmetsp:Transcript_65034/g.211941  ORF Transcript_65034/g.211941 Transcript_65034/m.211941 type:complete len:307 (+) Transcript_65034:1101-2021(+)